MAPYGIVVGKDNLENAKVRPEIRGKRPVILKGSRDRDYKDGQRVFYNETFPGEYVDFARIHYALDESGHAQISENWNEEQEPFMILRAVGEPED